MIKDNSSQLVSRIFLSLTHPLSFTFFFVHVQDKILILNIFGIIFVFVGNIIPIDIYG